MSERCFLQSSFEELGVLCGVLARIASTEGELLRTCLSASHEGLKLTERKGLTTSMRSCCVISLRGLVGRTIALIKSLFGFLLHCHEVMSPGEVEDAR